VHETDERVGVKCESFSRGRCQAQFLVAEFVSAPAIPRISSVVLCSIGKKNKFFVLLVYFIVMTEIADRREWYIKLFFPTTGGLWAEKQGGAMANMQQNL
jgi:hypothetical protein